MYSTASELHFLETSREIHSKSNALKQKTCVFIRGQWEWGHSRILMNIYKDPRHHDLKIWSRIYDQHRHPLRCYQNMHIPQLLSTIHKNNDMASIKNTTRRLSPFPTFIPWYLCSNADETDESDMIFHKIMIIPVANM